MAETILVGKKHYRRLPYGDTVQSCLSYLFEGAVLPQDRFAFGDKEVVGKIAFAFLDEIGKRQFDYSPEKFIREAMDIGAEGITALALQIAEIIKKESAQPFADKGDDVPSDPEKKKHIIVGWVTLALATYGFMNLLSLAFQKAYQLASGENYLTLIAKALF